tara:strand:+ start:308 stop:610 length:303 start_codon:yes stop_codon:yes gene_type:complete
MVRSEAQKKAQIKYRNKEEKYDKVKSINRKSNNKKYAEDEEFREKMKARQKEQYHKKKEKMKKEKEIFEKLTKQDQAESIPINDLPIVVSDEVFDKIIHE